MNHLKTPFHPDKGSNASWIEGMSSRRTRVGQPEREEDEGYRAGSGSSGEGRSAVSPSPGSTVTRAWVQRAGVSARLERAVLAKSDRT